YFGLTGQISPSKPPAMIFSTMILPTEPSRIEAPNTATDLGATAFSRLRVVMGGPPASSDLEHLPAATSLHEAGTDALAVNGQNRPGPTAISRCNRHPPSGSCRL